jgi:Mn-containing catalase
MSQLKELLVEQLQDLLHAEGQLTGALPKMAEAAHHPKLKEAFEKHLVQTESQIERLHKVFQMLAEEAEPKACKAMMGLIEEGNETIEESGEKEPITADLALIASAQRVEHYEIASYGTVRCLARQLGYVDAARLLSHTLGEEESSDFLLTAIADPLMQQASIEEGGNNVNLETVEKRSPARATKKADKPEKMDSRSR